MKIGIDISMLVYQGSGVANYTYNFVKTLLQIDSKNEYHLFYSSFRRPPNMSFLEEYKKKGAHVYSFRLPPRVIKYIWNTGHLLPVEWLIGKMDVYHSSDFLRPPLMSNTRGITTVHDLTWKLFPQYHTPDVVSAHEKKMQKTLKFGDTVLVDSKNTLKDLLTCYPEFNTEKIHVLYPGIDPRFRKIADINKVKTILSRYNVQFPNKYLLYVGAIEPRKNIETAVRTFAKLIKLAKFAEYKFLLVGRAGWKNENIFQLIRELQLESEILFVGYVSDDDLPYFYNAAQATMYISLYEGFGLPPLESAACGTPALLYQNSSMAETFPSSYPFCKVGTEQETLINLLEHKYSNHELQKISEKFSWINYANSFLQIVHQP